MKRIDETGNVYGKLTVVKLSQRDKHGKAHWKCKCECGNIAEVAGRELRNGHTQSCGCKRKKMIDEEGTVYGRLTVLGFSHKTKRHAIYWTCKCECGNITQVRADSLRRGTISCGCLQRETATTHGREGTPEYQALKSAIQRCYNHNDKSYSRYGGRGIMVHPGWRGVGGFERFLAHIGPRPSKDHSLHRFPGDGNPNYEPFHVRWATAQEQVDEQRPKKAIESFTDEELAIEVARRAKRASGSDSDRSTISRLASERRVIERKAIQ